MAESHSRVKAYVKNELTEIYQIESDFTTKVAGAFDELIARVGGTPGEISA